MSHVRTSRVAFTRAESGRVCGYVSTWEPPENHDTYGTVFGRGCFDEDIAERGPLGTNEIPSLWEHRDPFGMPVVLEDDATGLRMEVEPTQTRENEDRIKYVEHGVVRGMSVQFEPEVYRVHKDVLTPWGEPVIEFTKCRLIEGTITRRPSNHNALIDRARSWGLEWHRNENGMWVPRELGVGSPSTSSRDILLQLLDALDADPEQRAAALARVSRATGIDAQKLARFTSPSIQDLAEPGMAEALTLLDVNIERLLNGEP